MAICTVFRMINGKQVSRKIVPNLRRVDLGEDAEKTAKRLGCEIIRALSTGASPEGHAADESGNIEPSSSTKKAALTISALADRYAIDGLVRVTSGYKSDTLACLRRIGKFLQPGLLVRDLKPSHLEKFLASRIALKHAVAGRGALVALSIACNWAVGEGLLDVNPLASKRARDAMRIGLRTQVRRADHQQYDHYNDAVLHSAEHVPPSNLVTSIMSMTAPSRYVDFLSGRCLFHITLGGYRPAQRIVDLSGAPGQW